MNTGTIICTAEFMQTQMTFEMLSELVNITEIKEISIFDGIYQYKIDATSDLFTEPNSLWECSFSFNTDTKILTPKLRKYAERNE
jgi:hypothetical protein